MNTLDTCVDSGTRRNMRAYTSQILAAARELDAGLFRVQEKCLRALRVADLMKASRGRVPITDLVPFHEAIATSVRVLTGASTLIRDLESDTRRLSGELYKLPDPFKLNDGETEND